MGGHIKKWRDRIRARLSGHPKSSPAPADGEPVPDMSWKPGWVFTPGEPTEAHRDALLEDLSRGASDMARARELIEAEIAAAPEGEQAHMSMHLVRHLQSYALLPAGPGRLLDIGGPSLYSLPAHELKDWQIETIKILAIDYERDPLPLPDASVDAVTLCEVIEHFTFDPLYCLAEVNRVLRHGGVLLVSTPNAASWFAIYQALQHRPANRWPVYATPDAANRENHIHAREYLVSDLETLLAAAGFEIDRILTRDYGILPSYVPIPGFPEEHRGETIFCLARKAGPPRMRCVVPIYLEDRPWPQDVPEPDA